MSRPWGDESPHNSLAAADNAEDKQPSPPVASTRNTSTKRRRRSDAFLHVMTLPQAPVEETTAANPSKPTDQQPPSAKRKRRRDASDGDSGHATDGKPVAAEEKKSTPRKAAGKRKRKDSQVLWLIFMFRLSVYCIGSVTCRFCLCFCCRWRWCCFVPQDSGQIKGPFASTAGTCSQSLPEEGKKKSIPLSKRRNRSKKRKKENPNQATGKEDQKENKKNSSPPSEPPSWKQHSSVAASLSAYLACAGARFFCGVWFDLFTVTDCVLVFLFFLVLPSSQMKRMHRARIDEHRWPISSIESPPTFRKWCSS
jgi:hypothetical protein